MGYLRSTIVLQKNKLWKASLFSSWFWFGEHEEHETFCTLGEARDWLIAKRCTNLKQSEEETKEVATQTPIERKRSPLQSPKRSYKQAVINELKTKKSYKEQQQELRDVHLC